MQTRTRCGAPFQYAESLFAALAVVKSITGLSYRCLQGMLIETLDDGDSPWATQPYTEGFRHWRSRNGCVFTVMGGSSKTMPVRFAVDSTGLKQHNRRREWIRHKWKIRRGFVKLYVMVDVWTQRRYW